MPDLRTQSAIRNVVVLGAGAMGCLFAARMIGVGVHVTLVDNDAERIALLARDGLTIEDDSGARHVQPAMSLAADLAGPADLVLLFTKSVHSAAAVGSVAHLATWQPAALTLQNGVGNAEILAAKFGPSQVLMGTAHVPADMQSPTRVVSHGFAAIHLGGMNSVAHRLAQPVADLLRHSGFNPTVTGDVEVAIWEKLAFNAALNAMAMVAQASNGSMDNPSGRRIAAAIVAETVAVAQARGLILNHDRIGRSVQQALSEHPGHEASMLQDRKAQRVTEIESINGAICREGERVGVQTPVTATLADLVRIVESQMLGQSSANCVRVGKEGLRDPDLDDDRPRV